MFFKVNRMDGDSDSEDEVGLAVPPIRSGFAKVWI